MGVQTSVIFFCVFKTSVKNKFQNMSCILPICLAPPVKESVRADVMWKCILSLHFRIVSIGTMQIAVNQNRPLLYWTCQVSLLVPSHCWIVTGRTRKGKNRQNFRVGNLTSSTSACQTFWSSYMEEAKMRGGNSSSTAETTTPTTTQEKLPNAVGLVWETECQILFFPETFKKWSHINREAWALSAPNDFTGDWLHLQLNNDLPCFRIGTEQVKKLPFRLPRGFIIFSCTWLLIVAK